MARISGPMFSVFATGSFGKVITYKRRNGAFYLSKKRGHTGRLKPWEIAFKNITLATSILRRYQGQRPVFYPDPAFGFTHLDLT